MSAAIGTVRHPKGPAQPSSGPGAKAFTASILDSSVGAKIVVALTGIGLVGFVIVHMIGNLKLFQGPEAINHYAHFLQHEIGAFLWLARGGLLGIFVLHIALAVRLQSRARAARPIPYAYAGNVQATLASRAMLGTGIVIGLFVLFHLAHFTFCIVMGTEVYDPASSSFIWTSYRDLKDAKGRHDVYEMMVAGFSNGPIAIIYLLAQVALFLHLRHGVPSLFQTLGLKNARFRRPIDCLGLAVAAAVTIANCTIVLAVQFGYVPSKLM